MKFKAIFIPLLGTYLLITTSLIFMFTRSERIPHAIISMGLGLILLWVVAGGGLMFFFRENVKQFVQSIPLHWQIKFVIFGIMLALVEEAITTSMTNLAPLFGAQIGEAYITASTNYLDVVLHHSVIAFIPWFLAWAWILKRYNIPPFWVFLLFGLNGLVAESIAFGWDHMNEFALWIFVYGLMVWLPAYCIPEERGAMPPKLWHGAFAFLLTLTVGLLWAALINIIFPHHPSIHF